MNDKKNTVVALSRLKAGEWYVGDSYCGKVALWDSEFFICLDSNGQAVQLGYGEGPHSFAPYRMVL